MMNYNFILQKNCKKAKKMAGKCCFFCDRDLYKLHLIDRGRKCRFNYLYPIILYMSKSSSSIILEELLYFFLAYSIKKLGFSYFIIYIVPHLLIIHKVEERRCTRRRVPSSFSRKEEARPLCVAKAGPSKHLGFSKRETVAGRFRPWRHTLHTIKKT
ncbi:hypothetical protein AM501_26080 [Aneurinibacillus migulanus]|nr:hypothetical protein TS64_06295 [Aneurinibacillus migulanus]KPD05514.1 hypothetical protein AM501_26080 [Aneurinibacillus migulanus]